MRRIMSAAVLSFVALSAASAADVGKRVYPAPAKYSSTQNNNWEGFYLGINAGYAWGKGQSTSPYNAIDNLSVDAKGKGMTLGGVLGYRYQLTDAFTVGAFGTYDFGNIKGSGDSSTTYFGFIPAYSHMETSISKLWSVQAELGYSPMQNLLVALHAGIGGVSGNVRGSGTIFTTPITTFDQDVSKSAFVYGASLNYKLPNQWVMSLDWTHYKAGDVNVTATNFAGTQTFAVNMDVDKVSLGLSHAF